MPTVGEILVAERRRQGKSLNDVVEGTKIRSRLIDALEAGNYDDLPSPAYVKGYIQCYARYLEIPAEPLLEQYKRETEGRQTKNPKADGYLAGIPAEAIVPKREKVQEIPRKVWVVIAVALVLVLLTACVVTQLVRRGTGADTTPTTPSSTTTEAPATGDEGTTPVVTTGEEFKLRVSVRAGLASWVKVTFDGLTGFEGTMQGGESHEWLVTERARITIGKPDAVVITRDGKNVQLPSGPDSTVTLDVDD